MLGGRMVLVVVPAFEEAPRIGRVLRGIPAFVDHIVVVDDASRDATTAAVTSAGDARVRLVRHAANLGVGAAIVRGYVEALQLTSADEDAIAVMAGDDQMHPDDLERVVLPIVSGEADYVKGERFSHPEARKIIPWPRRVGGEVFSRLTSIAIGQPIHDSQCGYTAIARRVVGTLDLAEIWPRYGYPNDLLGKLALGGYRICEVSVRPVYADEESKLRPWHVITVARIVLSSYVARRRAALGR